MMFHRRRLFLPVRKFVTATAPSICRCLTRACLLSESTSKDVAPVVMPSFRYVRFAVTVQDLLVSDTLPDFGKVRLTRAHFEINQNQNSTGILTNNLQCSSVQGLSCESSTGRKITVDCLFSRDGMGGLVLGELQAPVFAVVACRKGCNLLGCATDQRRCLPWPHSRPNDRRDATLC
jgi:hypothetical protein